MRCPWRSDIEHTKIRAARAGRRPRRTAPGVTYDGRALHPAREQPVGMSAPNAPIISGGSLRGRRLEVPPGLTTRPTRSLVRQALFNMLAPRVPGARVLDLYSGSGALGLE